MSKEFGENLRRIRKNNTKYSQEDMARLLNISRSTYTYYETGKSEPNLFKVRRIHEILNVDINELLDYKE